MSRAVQIDVGRFITSVAHRTSTQLARCPVFAHHQFIVVRSLCQAARTAVGPRNVIHSWATDTDDPTVEPRWGKVGKQKIVDEGPLPPNPIEGIKYTMQTFDEVITQSTIAFINKAKEEDKPFFVCKRQTNTG